MRKEREFVYVGDPIPKIDPVKNIDFLLQIQKSMLLSLVKQKLLNTSQMERVIEELDSQYHKKKKPLS